MVEGRFSLTVPEAPSMVRRPVTILGAKLFAAIATIRGLGAFMLITLGVLVTKFNTAANVVHPLIRQQAVRCGLRLMPLVLFMAMGLGFVVIGQLVALSSQVGANAYTGKVMVTAIIRELGPLTTALLVLGRVGMPTVIELGTARALGEVETLETLGIDPIHYLVVPRVLGMMFGVFSLTVYLVLGVLAAGYLFAFVHNVPLTPTQYIGQLAASLGDADFLLLGLKSCGFGAIIATVSCYHGLARPMTLEEVSAAAMRTVAQSVAGCVLLDALFIFVYLLL